MSDFDDREDDHDDDDIEYTIKVRLIIFGVLFIYFQKIIGKRKNGRTYEYQVVWSGCDEDTATWEPEDNLQNAKGMISNFERGKSTFLLGTLHQTVHKIQVYNSILAQKKEFEAQQAKKRKARSKSASPKKSRK